MNSVGKVKINNCKSGYLIHGQPFSLQFEFFKTRWGIVFNRPGSMSLNQNKTRRFIPGSRLLMANIKWLQFFNIIKSKGELHLISNAFYPYVNFYLFSSFFSLSPKKIKIPLNVNFINTLEQNTHHIFRFQPLTPNTEVKSNFINISPQSIKINPEYLPDKFDLPRININTFEYPKQKLESS